MRRAVTHIIHQFSSAPKLVSSNSFQHHQTFSKPFIPYSQSVFQSVGRSSDYHFSMSSRQQSTTIANGVNEPLALPGGAPLKVKNSLSKEKVGAGSVIWLILVGTLQTRQRA